MNREPYRWRTLGLYGVYRSRTWQTCLTVLAGMAVVYGLLIAACF